MEIQKFEKELLEFRKQLELKNKIVITTHQNPDGDAIGAVFGLYWYLVNEGKDARIIVPNDYPPYLQWLPGNETVVNFSRKRGEAIELIKSAEIIFHLDYNDTKRSGDLKEKLDQSDAYKIMIDHHPLPQINADIKISDTTVSSTCELVLELILHTGGEQKLDIKIAESLYLGIMTDTGCFSFNSSNPRTFELISILLKAGIRKDYIFRLVYDNFSMNRMRLMGYCLNEKMEILPEYNTAFISISLEEQEQFKFETGDSEGFVNLPLSIKGINFTALFIEREDKVKISLRSKGSFPVNVVADKYFLGGGHLNAAGGESRMPLLETLAKFRSILPLYANELKY
ncbi:MAG TPA: bifunctional oligoribonuclease/PAP phosphatase NrnA [Bacteroidales bacterium]|nr:bifunctional oligoribonuclease/PAP phosphatase NrnA [Bacteroidales bacterium]